MPSTFQEQMGLTHHTKPVMGNRRINAKNLINGVGVTQGFYSKVTSPISQKILVSRGIAVGPDGEEITVALDPTLQGVPYQKALTADWAEVDASAVIGTTLNPASHALLFTMDIVNDTIIVHKITTAEKGSIDAAITNPGDEATSAFDAATGDHAARGRGDFTNPDTFEAGVTVATEYVLATATVDGVGGDIDAVTVKREQRVAWADMAL
jgi:hypothetical protein